MGSEIEAWSVKLQEPFATDGQRIRGTPAYIPPEQWKGADSSSATDIWALGIMLYELVAGRRPYEGSGGRALIGLVCAPEPVPPLDGEGDSHQEALQALIRRCLDKDPQQRPGAEEVVRELKKLLLHWDWGAATEEQSPFRGLQPFDERHQHFFFGRESEIAAFVERLRHTPVLPVIGPSGAGKSSFVGAGVIPRLRERGPLEVLQLRPGSDPFGALAARIVAARRGLSSSRGKSPFGVSFPREGSTPGVRDDTVQQPKDPPAGDPTTKLAEQLKLAPTTLTLELHRLAEKLQSSVLLFVDQLEELFTLAANQGRRDHFILHRFSRSGFQTS